MWIVWLRTADRVILDFGTWFDRRSWYEGLPEGAHIEGFAMGTYPNLNKLLQVGHVLAERGTRPPYHLP